MQFVKLWVLLTCVMQAFSLNAAEVKAVAIEPQIERQYEPSHEFKVDEQTELGNIYRHRDMYIVSGKPDTKVQFSFKLRFVEKWQLYLGYTQLMFWDLGTADSNPFRDIAYNPELFYVQDIGAGVLRTVSFGVEHRSNGRDSLQSRSFDRIFIQANNYFGMGDAKFSFALRGYAFYDLDRTNKDIQEYTGFWDARLTASSFGEWWFPSKSDVYFSFFPGGNYSTNLFKGGQEIGLRIRVRLFSLLPYLLLQAYRGHSESLLDYEESVEAYRIGFLL